MKKVIFLSIICFLLSTTHVFAQSVDLLWQGNGYVPPFYQGRTIWSKQSGVTVLALTQGLGNPSNLYFKWSKNGTSVIPTVWGKIRFLSWIPSSPNRKPSRWKFCRVKKFWPALPLSSPLYLLLSLFMKTAPCTDSCSTRKQVAYTS